MELESLQANWTFTLKVFAPCMGLESDGYTAHHKPHLFAPCVGLERRNADLPLSYTTFALCMGLKNSSLKNYHLME